MAIPEYTDARKRALREVRAAQDAGKDPYLPVLADMLPGLTHMSQVSLGLVQIPLSQVVGTVTRGRTTAFSSSFYPLLHENTEFATKWSDLYTSVIEEGINQPVRAFEYYNLFYILEGNKRISVSKMLDSPFIEAEVTRILPEPEDTPRYRIYQEFLTFYRDTSISTILFNHEGGFPRLYALTLKTPGVKWNENDIFDLRSAFYRFSQAYQESGMGETLPVSDAFLIYLQIFSYNHALDCTPSQFKADIIKLRNEYVVAAANKSAAILSEPSEENPSFISSLLHRTYRKLQCAFLYNRSPELSGWTYWHELGRSSLEKAFGDHVEALRVDNVGADTAPQKMEELISSGYRVIFATSPVFMDACMLVSTAHPECKILNCSLLASYHNIRSYYLRIFEAKFILGAIAGILTENNQIGYIADYPIYGIPASVNAFALGAQMVNPRAKVVLDWSTIEGHNPETAMHERGISIISNRDISAPLMETRAYGLYSITNGRIQNLAMPVLNWSRVYQGIIRSILTGAWEEEGDQHPDRALNYYMGMSTGAIDVLCSDKIPPRIQLLASTLREDLKAGRLSPFTAPLVDQAGNVRLEKGALKLQQIIQMDYLLDNVEGRIPEIGELTGPAQRMASIQGLHASTGNRLADPALGVSGNSTSDPTLGLAGTPVREEPTSE